MANIHGKPGVDDDLSGGAESDSFWGYSGNDFMKGVGGDDTFRGGEGADTLWGGIGIDRAMYDDSKTGVWVDLGFNVAYYGTAQGDTFSGIENLTGSYYGDTLYGDDGANHIQGNGGDDYLYGRGGDDTLEGSGYLDGGADHDQLRGASQADDLYGGSGNDRLDGRGGADWLVGGAGIDTVIYEASAQGVTVFLSDTEGNGYGGDAQGDKLYEIENVVGSLESDFISGTDGRNLLDGSWGGDTLKGYGGDDTLDGDFGDDVLIGGAGIDHLDGGFDADSLYGGEGKDSLVGGGGADRFYFNTALNAATNVDKIDDMKLGQDTIWLDRAIFTGLSSGADGVLSAANFHMGPAAADASDRIIYDSATGKLFYDADGTGGIAAVQFATLDTFDVGQALSRADFHVF